jgi:two-component system response regulator HydG
MMTEVLLIDSDAEFTAATSDSMRHEGYAVRVANSMQEAREAFTRMTPQVLVMDWRLPDGCGLDLLDGPDCPDVRTVVVTDHPSVESAIESLRKRVSDYLIKPVDLPRLMASMRMQEPPHPPVVSAGRQPRRGTHRAAGLCDLVGQTPVMRRLYGRLEKVASTYHAAVIMRDEDLGRLPVVGEDGTLLGAVTDRDIVVRGLAEGREADTAVEDVMTPGLVCCDAGDDILTVARMME